MGSRRLRRATAAFAWTIAIAVTCSVPLHAASAAVGAARDRAPQPAKRADFNGDGFTDLAVGAPNAGPDQRGVVTIGFGSATGIDLPGEASGLVPPLDGWRGATLYTIGFGQGISATPLQMLVAGAALANDGVVVRPRVLRAVRDAEGRGLQAPSPVTEPRAVSVEAALMAIVGGTGTLVGPFIGSGIILGLRNWVSSFFELYAAVMGLVFIAAVLWAPQGIVGLVARLQPRALRARDG